MESQNSFSCSSDPGELLAHFPDVNNSCSSLYLGILDGPEIIRALSSPEERCLETQGNIMIPVTWVGGVETKKSQYISLSSEK